MSESKNNLTVVVNQQDGDGVDIIKRVLGVLSYDGICGEYDNRRSPDTAQHTLDLPTTTVLQVVVYNKHATGIITLVGTPAGGAEATLCKLGPGDIYVYWAPSNATGAGFTSLKYTADTSATEFEMFLGG